MPHKPHQDCGKYDRFEKLLAETQHFTIRRNEGKALKRHLTSCATWYQYLQIIGIPIVTTIGWLLIPLAMNTPLVNYWLYTMIFLAFYWFWIQATGLYLFHHFVLPGLPHFIRILLVVGVLGLEGGYWWLVRYVLHAEKDKMVYNYPGWMFPASTSITYLFYGIYLNVKLKRQREARHAATTSIDGSPLIEDTQIQNTPVSTNPFDIVPGAVSVRFSPTGSIVNAADLQKGPHDDDNDDDSVKASSSDDDDDGLEPDDDLLAMLHGSMRAIPRVRFDPPPSPHDDSHQPLLESPFIGDPESQSSRNPFDEDVFTGAGNPFDDEAASNSDRDEPHLHNPQYSPPMHDHHASLRRFVRGITHHVPNLTEADVKNPLRNTLLGAIFLMMLAGVWYLNIAMYTVFANIKGSNSAIRFTFAVGFQALAFMIKQIIVKFVMQLPRRRQIKSIARFGLDTLFFLYYRALFINVPDIVGFIGMSGGGIIMEILLYPLRMTRLYTRVFNGVKTFFKYKLFCLKRKPDDESIPQEIKKEAQYRQHKRDLALDYYFHNLARIMSAVCLILIPIVLRYSYNSQLWQFKPGTEESGGIPEDRFRMLMMFYAIQFVMECLCGFIMKYMVFGRLFNVDADFLGSLLCSSLAVRVCLIGLTGHFLHDIWYFTMDIVPQL